MNNLVSVIITTYNSSQTIEKTIMSVINQSYKDIEILIYDDCSKDNTIALIEKLIDPLKINCNIMKASVNFGGPAKGRNWGCANANGRYICFLDADDIWKEFKVETQLKCMKENNIDISSTNSTVINGIQFASITGYVSIYSLLKRNKLILSSVMMKKEIIESLKYVFNEDKKYISVEDYDLFLRLAILKFKIFVIPQRLIYYTVIQSSLSHNDFKENENKRLYVLRKTRVTNVFQFIWKWVVIIVYKFK